MMDDVSAAITEPEFLSIPAHEPELVEPPTLGDAFRILCEAMIPHLDDNVPAQMKCEEIQIWHDNGNHAVAWAHCIMLLEGILGTSLRR